jgi:glyoxylase-like metal-dependent hydrolase (beta-lactamase superfamily II)
LTLRFNLDFDPSYGKAVEVFPGVTLLTAPNPGPFTFHGTNSYIVGHDDLAVIDPGPDSDEHLASLLRAIDGRPVHHILVSHTHRDHSPLAKRLAKATGATTHAEGPHRAARPSDRPSPVESGADRDFVPDVLLRDGDLLRGNGWSLGAVFTPGHAANHMAFALQGTGVLFSADHVMGWSTTIVAPPDGSMADYMQSLNKLIARSDKLLLPGHGGAITEPASFMRGLKEHRLAREAAVLERLRLGDRGIGEIVAAIYRDTNPAMYPAASLSVLAHLEHLVDRGMVACEGEPSIGGIFRPV